MIRDVVAQFFDATLAGTGRSIVAATSDDVEVEVLAREDGSDQ